MITKLRGHKAYDEKLGFYDEESFVDEQWIRDDFATSHWISSKDPSSFSKIRSGMQRRLWVFVVLER
jgi:hypothetical protein